MTKAKSSSKAAPKKAAKKSAAKKVKKAASKKVAKVLSVDCPDLSNKKRKDDSVIIPSAQERLDKRRELSTYLKQERDPQKRTAARRAWSNWFKGKAA